MTNEKIDVLLADDSAVARMMLVHLLESDQQIRVIGVVNDGQAALDFLAEGKPDVIVMDIHMPRLDGFEATRRIMETQPVPIVICTATTNPSEIATTFRVMEAGAVACVAKPLDRERADFGALAADLLQTIKLMSEVKMVRRWPRARVVPTAAPPVTLATASAIKVIGIGASTGGPPVLRTILECMPSSLPAPVLIVQHIAHGFLSGLVEWLQQNTGWTVRVAEHGTSPLPGHAYLAPDDFHMGLTPGGRIFLSAEERENGLRPAVSFLFRSLAESYGRNALGVLLTGMGKDGAAELKLLRDRGAETIAQDRESSVVHGMPGEAIELGGATHIVSADKIGDVILTLVNRRQISRGIES
jgi:two-component system chemotaxis response regulator CheB